MTDMPNGYKMTEVGVIPEEWEVCHIGDFAQCFSGGTPNTSNPAYYGGDISWITSSDLNQGRITDVQGRITELGATNSAVKFVDKGTLLLALYGATAGVCAVTNIEAAINQAVLAIFTKRVDTEYLFQFLTLYKSRFIHTYTQGGQPNFSGAIVKSFAVTFPSAKAEQRAIAAALSDVDALLAGLDRLIAKKRDLKQAAMQQLLTGQTRMPGFKGEWCEALLGNIARIKTGKKNNEDKVDNGEYPFFVRSADVEHINSFSYECEAILIPGEGNIGSIFHYINGRFDVHQRVYAITQFREDVSARFLHAYMTQFFGAWALQNTVKATVDSLRLPTFQNFLVELPPTLAEQAAIASVLSDMDAEIDSLERRRAKTADMKQAMMQELLTGRTRLV
ncbi:restriction endonuclease subunit S [Oligosphaera ethanolica]|uniref:Type I restriction enzyme S subunit n=1 Tax=Oligosphaera ethanolica TaxID=760260 RepID=A0AAE4AMN0_9BACT|nr:restriction endonuclease subunit S [Oligosphaera ethanolica]MDQ0288671.1 type I restriction enzyme S subunit [Oligosphaera ethanolica]